MRFQGETVEVMKDGLDIVPEKNWPNDLEVCCSYIWGIYGLPNTQKLFRNSTKKTTFSKTIRCK